MFERKVYKTMSREQIDKIIYCGCEHGIFVMPFACETSFLNLIPISTTICCLCCDKKVTRLTTKGAVKAWNKIVLM